MDQLNINEIKKHFSAVMKRVQKGETIVVSSYNKPIAEIRPLSKPLKEPRPIGLCKGEFVVSDNFNDPLPEEILEEFEGKYST